MSFFQTDNLHYILTRY